jgi:cystathionine beta-lyase family protein involved in aluminum resistance
MDNLINLYSELGISKEVLNISDEIILNLSDRFQKIDKIAEYNQLKVLSAFRKNKVSEAHFTPTTGYGYNDLGRDTLEKVYADVFHTEDALVRSQITCGTHALGLALSANLRPGDKMMYISGKPYDTLEEVIGIRPSIGSLAEYGVKYDQVELTDDGNFDFDCIKSKIKGVKLIGIQRSKGYATRPTLSVNKIAEVIKFIKNINPKIIIMVDNCYGEFVECIEPSDVGADMTVGSLIKNPGGGLAPIGGYICGTKECIENCAYRLTTPGLGKEVGANLGTTGAFYQGLFMAPTVVASALKGAVFAAKLFEKYNFKVIPDGSEERHDIIQAIEFGNPESIIAFCKGIQASAPVDSYVTPEPWDMPGYDAPVIMAAGAFVSGASIELSADGPIKAPYAVYFQGGLTWQHAKIGIMTAFQYMVNDELIRI